MSLRPMESYGIHVPLESFGQRICIETELNQNQKSSEYHRISSIQNSFTDRTIIHTFEHLHVPPKTDEAVLPAESWFIRVSPLNTPPFL